MDETRPLIVMAEKIRPIEQMLELNEEESLSPEHLDSQVQKAQEQLLHLKRQQEQIEKQKRELEERLAKLNRVEIIRESGSANPLAIVSQAPRRKYPKVLPKYANPQSPLETWSGRGKQPRWLVAALKTGHKLDEFKIGNVEKGVRKGRAARSQRT